MIPLVASGTVFAAWILSWFIAALWSRRTTARPPRGARAPDLVLTVVGAGLIAYAARTRALLGDVGPFAWRLPPAFGWLLMICMTLGLAFTWWARLTLGDLWSGQVVRKEAHVIVRGGPYRLVRHPIYTGLIVALFAWAVQLGRPAAVVGALLMAVGFWAKARLEERFLSAELGDAYAAFRRETPMLIPGWPVRR